MYIHILRAICIHSPFTDVYDAAELLRKNQLHENCVKFIKKIHGNIADYKIFVTFALKYEKMNNY